MGKFLRIIGHFAFTVSLGIINTVFWSLVIGQIMSCVHLPDRVGDVSIFRDPEQFVWPGDGMQVRVKTIVEICVCNNIIYRYHT